MSYITVCTPTYNRAYCLDRPFNSLQKQSFKDFEWLVIDDGSSDNTEEKIEQFRKEALFPIMYVKKQNGGRASALNESYKHIKSKYVINLDSDDELVPDALEKIKIIWESIPKEEYDRFWCISGACIDSATRKVIGGVWPGNINQLVGKEQRKAILKYKGGEKSCCRKFDILKQYPFPKLEGTTFVPEDMVWEQINKKYDQYCTNEVFRVYFTDSADSLCTGTEYSVSRKISYYYFVIYYLNNFFDEFFYNQRVRRFPLDASRLAILIKRRYCDVMRDLEKWYLKVLVTIGWPFMFIFNKIYYRR